MCKTQKYLLRRNAESRFLSSLQELQEEYSQKPDLQECELPCLGVRGKERSFSRWEVTLKTNYRCYRLSPTEVSFASLLWEADQLHSAEVSLQTALQFLFP